MARAPPARAVVCIVVGCLAVAVNAAQDGQQGACGAGEPGCALPVVDEDVAMLQASSLTQRVRKCQQCPPQPGASTLPVLQLLQWNPGSACTRSAACTTQAAAFLTQALQGNLAAPLNKKVDFAHVAELTDYKPPSGWSIISHTCEGHGGALIYNSKAWASAFYTGRGCLGTPQTPTPAGVPPTDAQAFLIKAFQPNDGQSHPAGDKVVVVGASYPLDVETDALQFQLANVLESSRLRQVILIADTLATSNTDSLSVLRDILPGTTAVQTTDTVAPRTPTCCWGQYYRTSYTYDRVMANFGAANIRTAVLLDPLPQWAYSDEMHKPVLGQLNLAGTTTDITFLQWNPHYQCFQGAPPTPCFDNAYLEVQQMLGIYDVDFANVIEQGPSLAVPAGWDIIDSGTTCASDKNALIFNSKRWAKSSNTQAAALGCIQPNSRSFIVQVFDSLLPAISGSIIVVGAHFPHPDQTGQLVLDPLTNALAAVLALQITTRVVVLADTNVPRSTSSAAVLNLLKVPPNAGYSSTSLEPTCCYGDNFQVRLAFDRAISNFGTKMDTAVAFNNALPSWADSEGFHKPLFGTLHP